MNYGNIEIPGSLFKLARDRMLRDATLTAAAIRDHLVTEGHEMMMAISTIPGNHQIIAARVMRACLGELRTAGDVTQAKRGVWARTGALDSAGTDRFDMARLQRTRGSWERATAGKWSWNCAGEVLAQVDGQDVVIGNFNGCAADAEAVCRLHNNALALFEAARVAPAAMEPG